MKAESSNIEHPMPDIAMRSLEHDHGTLDWVGMREIRLPVRVQDGAEICEVVASVQMYVDLLDPKAKGIHMSRLYVLLDEATRSRTFSPRCTTTILAGNARLSFGSLFPCVYGDVVRTTIAARGTGD